MYLRANSINAEERGKERERAQKQSKAKGDMDDTYLWSHSREHLQASLAELERRLGQHGLEINPDNTAIIHSCRDRGWHLHHRGEDGGMQALWGSHHGPGVTHHLWGGSGGDSDRDEPQSTTSLSQTRPPAVRPHGPGGENPAAPDGGGHVGAEAWQNTAAIFKAANSTQTAQVRRMMHPGRRPGESWEEWNVRTLRAARLAIHRAGVPAPMRHTHAGQFNPMVDPERQLTKVAGDAWQEVARNPKIWGTLKGEYLQQFDVPWSTGKAVWKT